VPLIVEEVLRTAGQPLDPAAQAFFEPRFNHDFSRVRVHTDRRADQSARAVGALAYTVGHHVAFRAGQYAPATQTGRRLLAHELAHVVQQAGGAKGGETRMAPADDAREREAERAAQMISDRAASPEALSGLLGTSSRRLQRLGANPGCTEGETAVVHQAIFNARGWINKAIPQLGADPISDKVVASLRKNFGPTYGVRANAQMILGRIKMAYKGLSTFPISCAGVEDATCNAASPPCGYTPGAGAKAFTICRNASLTAGADVIYQAGCVLHESLHASFTKFTIDEYSGWHGHSGSSATYPGTGTDPLLNADSYTTLVMDLS
jgi:hypothetical protein